jgi:hypothetical protein
MKRTRQQPITPKAKAVLTNPLGAAQKHFRRDAGGIYRKVEADPDKWERISGRVVRPRAQVLPTVRGRPLRFGRSPRMDQGQRGRRGNITTCRRLSTSVSALYFSPDSTSCRSGSRWVPTSAREPEPRILVQGQRSRTGEPKRFPLVFITAESLARELGGRRSGPGWMARCPAHDDNKPSLSISVRNGKVLVHCFAGCGQQNVIDALRARGLWALAPRERNASMKVVAGSSFAKLPAARRPTAVPTEESGNNKSI